MQTNHRTTATGHVRLVRRQRGPDKFYARLRVGQKQINRVIGPVWERRSRPPEGWFTKETAQAALGEMLAEMREPKAGATVAVTFEQAADEWLRYAEHDREVRVSTLVDYKATAQRLKATFGERELTTITAQDVEAYKTDLLSAERKPSARTVNRHLVILGGIFRRAEPKWGVRHNPAAATVVKRQREQYGGRINFYTPDQVQALVGAAGDEQDAALFLTAALTGLRQGELLALRWRDVNFQNERVHVERSFSAAAKTEEPPKSGKVRSVPMVADVVAALDGLSKREKWTGPDDLVFPAWGGHHQYHGDLRARYKAAQQRAGLKPITFHELRHTFGTLAAQKFPLLSVKAWMGHANTSTTEIYAHYAPASDEAEKLGAAFRASTVPTEAVMATS